MTEIMLDLETLDTRPSAVVLSIGAVAFSRVGIFGSFYAVLDRDPQKFIYERSESRETLEWWKEQPPEARAVFSEKTVPPLYALGQFSQWMSAYDGAGLWGNGAAFDNVILRSLYDSVGVEAPWSFTRDRCYRTVRAQRKCNGFVDLPSEGVAHNALDDAMYQAKNLLAMQAAAGTLKLIP